MRAFHEESTRKQPLTVGEKDDLWIDTLSIKAKEKLPFGISSLSCQEEVRRLACAKNVIPETHTHTREEMFVRFFCFSCGQLG